MKNMFLLIIMGSFLTSCSGGGGGDSTPATASPAIPALPTGLCSDLNSSNIGSSLPCICNNGYSLSVDGLSCSLTPTPPGIAYTYNSIFGSYSPDQSATTPCSGTIATSRVMTCQRSDTVIVSNSFCSIDPAPNYSVQSKSGTITTTSTNISLSNGIEYKTCIVGSTTGTNSITCNSGYHLEGTTLANSNCYSNVISCTSMPSGSLTATQTWNGSSYGSCLVGTCNTAQNYIKVGNACLKCLSGETAQINNTCLSSEVNAKISLFQGSAMHIASTSQTRSWGSNAYYQLGLGDATIKSASMNMTFPTGRYPVKIEKNSSNTSYYAIMDNGSLMAWGSNAMGQLGLGATANITTPTLVNLGTGRSIKRLIVGKKDACAILDNYLLSCWGDNVDGELGLGHSSIVNTPANVSLGTGRTALDVLINTGTNSIMCVILDDNSLKCSGYNNNGELGDATAFSRNSLTSVILGSGILAKKLYSLTGTNTYISTCAQTSTDDIKCWGRNDSGKLGVGDTLNKTSPTSVNLGSGKTLKEFKISNTSSSPCAILNDDTLKCWGANTSGELGDGSSINKSTPTFINVGTGRTVKNYVGYNYSSFAILDNNSMVSWGSNVSGQLGFSGALISPQVVNVGVNSVKNVIVSDYLSCITTTTNLVMCSGINISGSVGNGVMGGSYTSFQSVSLGSGRTVSELQSSAYSTCALLDNNQVKCWGAGTSGQLGDNSNQNSASPVIVL